MFTSKQNNALKLMVCLGENQAVTIKELSVLLSLSVSHLESMASGLRKEGLIKAIHGPYGGYVLARNPHSISVGDILNTFTKLPAPHPVEKALTAISLAELRKKP